LCFKALKPTSNLDKASSVSKLKLYPSNELIRNWGDMKSGELGLHHPVSEGSSDQYSWVSSESLLRQTVCSMCPFAADVTVIFLFFFLLQKSCFYDCYYLFTAARRISKQFIFHRCFSTSAAPHSLTSRGRVC
jgi:hypothetical protein